MHLMQHIILKITQYFNNGTQQKVKVAPVT